MNNSNNNGTNGKEVFNGQMDGNVPKGNTSKPAHRGKRKVIPSENKVNPVEPKKIPLTIKKNPQNINRNNPKGQVIKLEEKESKIRPIKPETSKADRPASSSAKGENMYSNNESKLRSGSSDSRNTNIEKSNYKVSDNVGKLLLMAGILFFLAWAVLFFYYRRGGNVHMFLALAVVCGIVSLLGSKKR